MNSINRRIRINRNHTNRNEAFSGPLLFSSFVHSTDNLKCMSYLKTVYHFNCMGTFSLFWVFEYFTNVKIKTVVVLYIIHVDKTKQCNILQGEKHDLHPQMAIYK